MARQRKIIPDSKISDKGSSSSNGSSKAKPNNKTKKKGFTSILSHWKKLVLICVTGVAVCFGYMGYLETRVNTPYSINKVVKKSGLDVPEQFWGSYRPGLYFGLKTRDPNSMVTGLMWYFTQRLGPGADGIKHWCEQGDNLRRYGWLKHDGTNFGVQEIQDTYFQINTSFVKRPGGLHGGDWTARISVDILPEFKDVAVSPKGEEVSIIWYAALDSETEGSLSTTNLATDLTGIRGDTSTLGVFTIKLIPIRGEVSHESFLSTTAPGLHLLKETVMSALRLEEPNSYDSPKSENEKKNIVLGGELTFVGYENKPTNFVAVQVTGKMPFAIDVLYESGSFDDRPSAFVGEAYTNSLEWHISRFNQRFEDSFALRHKGYPPRAINFAQAALSNMVGGIGYFYGASLVQSHYTKEPVTYWKAPLFTAVPSRSFFPRGFLWDEGFHGLLISSWELDMEIDIISHWFDLINIEGWIPREQILGVEAVQKVPKEFVVQKNTNANPPTFFLTLQFILNHYEQDLTNERLEQLDRLFPRLQAWYAFFNNTQKGDLPGSYRWRGRDAFTNKELNPKTLTSGLDDFPRASHPTELERHIDLYCWMAVASTVMAKLSYILGKDSYQKYQQASDYLLDNALMDRLHWSNFSGRYADYGLHTDAIKLERPKPLPRQPNQNLEMVRVVTKQPEYRLVDSYFGYVNIFPFLLEILETHSPHLGKILTDIRRPDLMWSDFGLRSLSKSSPLYMARNTEHDPPYWRGQIWINMNYLACRALFHYSNVEGPYREQAKKIYEELRTNVINNVIKQYYKTGYMWEQYNDRTGEGSGCRPFTGWTALVVLLMSEKY